MATQPRLTPRELDVMWLVASDRTSKEIGRILTISPRTVEMHVRSSMRKLGCATRAGAVWRLACLGLFPRSVGTGSSDGAPTAVDRQRGAVDVGRLVAGEEGYGRADLLRGARTP
jgi:DNA-binding CsgD family transcriptional regulator